MSKEEYYSKIKKFVYRKFDELELVERNNGNYLYLRYNHEELAQIVIDKNSGWVFYNYSFRDKIFKILPHEKRDFDILLSRWIEETFKIKVNNIHGRGWAQWPHLLKITPK